MTVSSCRFRTTVPHDGFRWRRRVRGSRARGVTGQRRYRRRVAGIAQAVALLSRWEWGCALAAPRRISPHLAASRCISPCLELGHWSRSFSWRRHQSTRAPAHERDVGGRWGRGRGGCSTAVTAVVRGGAEVARRGREWCEKGDASSRIVVGHGGHQGQTGSHQQLAHQRGLVHQTAGEGGGSGLAPTSSVHIAPYKAC